MKEIASFVFLDLETTGIPTYEHNKTKITELSMIAVKSQHLVDLNGKDTPRVQHKLTLCLNPLRLVDPGASSMTKLSNELLEFEPRFDHEVFGMINSFINLLQKPVCLVAYNGSRFDYPVLKNHLEYLKVTLPDDLFCLDAYDAFYFILERKSSSPNRFHNNVDVESNSKNISLISTNHNIPFGKKQNVQQQTENYSPINVLGMESESEIDSIFSTQILEKTTSGHNQNEETEIQSKKSHTLIYDAIPESKIKEHSIEFFNNATPTQKKQKECCSTPKKIPVNKKTVGHARRRLPWSAGEKPKFSYKLVDVYERLLNCKAIDSHKAETDCLLMLECAVVLSQKFIDWANQNKELFSKIEPMQLGVPL